MPVGPLIIVAGPTGSGKSTLIRRALEAFGPRLRHSVSATTRDRRPGEADGVHYHFWTRERFQRGIEDGEFLEFAIVHGKDYYGTPRDEVRAAVIAGRDAILKIDVQGAAVVKQKVPEALLVFLVPPSLEDLFSRLQARATETADELDIRQRNAALELARQEDYDHVVLNETGEVERTAAHVDEVIRAEKADHPDRRTRV